MSENKKQNLLMFLDSLDGFADDYFEERFAFDLDLDAVLLEHLLLLHMSRLCGFPFHLVDTIPRNEYADNPCGEVQLDVCCRVIAPCEYIHCKFVIDPVPDPMEGMVQIGNDVLTMEDLLGYHQEGLFAVETWEDDRGNTRCWIRRCSVTKVFADGPEVRCKIHKSLFSDSEVPATRLFTDFKSADLCRQSIVSFKHGDRVRVKDWSYSRTLIDDKGGAQGRHTGYSDFGADRRTSDYLAFTVVKTGNDFPTCDDSDLPNDVLLRHDNGHLFYTRQEFITKMVG